jgi:hypothetical protein
MMEITTSSLSPLPPPTADPMSEEANVGEVVIGETITQTTDVGKMAPLVVIADFWLPPLELKRCV